MKRLSIIAILFGLTALSPAPIIDTRKNVRIEPEKTEAQRTLDQTGARMGEVGTTPMDTERANVPSIMPDSKAQQAVAAAASKTIVEAGKDVPTAGAGGTDWKRWIWGALIVAAAFGLVQVFKMWADKALPDAPGSRR